MAFYTFRQNNSGGSFYGPRYVIVEAGSADEANRIAEDHDVYFNGCMTGMDCSCCGDRWYACDESDACPQPMIYGDALPLDADTYKDSWGDVADIKIVRKPDGLREHDAIADKLAAAGFDDAAEFLRNQS